MKSKLEEYLYETILEEKEYVEISHEEAIPLLEKMIKESYPKGNFKIRSRNPKGTLDIYWDIFPSIEDITKILSRFYVIKPLSDNKYNAAYQKFQILDVKKIYDTKLKLFKYFNKYYIISINRQLPYDDLLKIAMPKFKGKYNEDQIIKLYDSPQKIRKYIIMYKVGLKHAIQKQFLPKLFRDLNLSLVSNKH